MPRLPPRARLVVSMLVLGVLGLACAGAGQMDLENPVHVDSDGLTFDVPRSWEYSEDQVEAWTKVHTMEAEAGNMVAVTEIDGGYVASEKDLLDEMDADLITSLQESDWEVTVSGREATSVQLAEVACPGQTYVVTMHKDDQSHDFEVTACTVRGERKVVAVLVVLGETRTWLYRPGVDLVLGSMRVP